MSSVKGVYQKGRVNDEKPDPVCGETMDFSSIKKKKNILIIMSSRTSSLFSSESMGNDDNEGVRFPGMHAAMLGVLGLIHDEMAVTNTMYGSYPHWYDQAVADTNNRLYARTFHLFFRDYGGPTLEGARLLVDNGVATTMARAYFNARCELTLGRGSPVDVRDAYESIIGFAREWRGFFEVMEAEAPGDTILAEVMMNMRADDDEVNDLRSVKAKIQRLGLDDWKARN